MAPKTRRGLRSELQGRARGEYIEEPGWVRQLIDLCLRLSNREKREAIGHLRRIIDRLRAALEAEEDNGTR